MAQQPGISMERQGELMRGVFKLLIENPDGLSGREVMNQLSEVVPFTDYELGHYESNPTEPRGVIATRFWSVNCVKAGWLVKSKAAWTLTDEGRRAYAVFSDPGEFARESQRRYNEWKRKQTPPAGEQDTEMPDGPDEGGTSAEAEQMTVEVAEEAAWTLISDFLSSMDPFEFQNLVAALLRAMGYHVSWVSPPGPDRGIDIVAYTDPLGALGPRIKVQVKRRADRMRVDDVRAFLAVLGANDVGLYISTGGFTSDAEREVRSQENRRITLIDMERLFDLWTEHYESVADADKAMLPLRPVYFLASRD